MPGVTIATSQKTPDGATDDHLLSAALATLGVETRLAIWDDPSVDWRATPIVVVRSTWDYHLKPRLWFEWLQHVSACASMVNPAEALRWNSSKRYLIDLARAAVPIIPTMLIEEDDAASLPARCAERGWSDIVVKPAIGAGAHGARRCESDDGHHAAGEHAGRIAAEGPILVQPYHHAVETERERSVVIVGERLSHAFTKPPFHSGADASAVRLHQPSDAEVALAQQAIAACPFVPRYARVDMIPSADGPLLMELELIEPRLELHLEPGGASRLASALLASKALDI